jgi:PIN domain-containing protein
MSIPNLLFIDTNIWLDFYRARTGTGLTLLKHTEAIADQIIVTYQLESEFKRNRQAAILEGLQELKAPQQMSRPGIFSDAKAIKAIAKDQKQAERRVKDLKRRLVRVLEDPGLHDPVYKVCQRVFHKSDDISLSRDNVLRHGVRRRAFRRFLQGAPPRKKNDTSIGDAFNWEWMVYCATQRKAGLVIVSRDSDYGVTVDEKSYINDHLRQEFSERVSRKCSLILYSRLSEALKHFAVEVSPQEEAAEKELVSDVAQRSAESVETPPDFVTRYQLSQADFLRRLAEVRPRTLDELFSKIYAPPTKVGPVKVEGESEKERTSKQFADTKDEGQPGGSRE